MTWFTHLDTTGLLHIAMTEFVHQDHIPGVRPARAVRITYPVLGLLDHIPGVRPARAVRITYPVLGLLDHIPGVRPARAVRITYPVLGLLELSGSHTRY